MAELPQPAAVPGHQCRPPAADPVHEERFIVAGVERAHHVGRPHDRDRLPGAAVTLEQHVLAGDLVSRVVAPVETARRLLGVRDRQGVVVDPAGRDEDHVGRAGERVDQGGHVLAHGGRVGDVVDRVEASPGEARAQARVVLAVARDQVDPGGQALALPAAVEDGDVVAPGVQRPQQVEADELGPAHHEHAHGRADSIRASRSA